MNKTNIIIPSLIILNIQGNRNWHFGSFARNEMTDKSDIDILVNTAEVQQYLTL